MWRSGRNRRARRQPKRPWWARVVPVDTLDRVVVTGIGLFALAAVIWAGAEFVDTGRESSIVVVSGAAAAEVAWEPIPFHRLMPEAADDLGRPVVLDGTVAAVAESGGLWVRDLRGYTVYVPRAEGVNLWAFAAGDPVRVRGRIALLPAGNASERIGEAERGLEAGALLVRGVMIVPRAGGVEALTP